MVQNVKVPTTCVFMETGIKVGALHIRPDFFYFSFYRPSWPIFLKIGKKEFFFNFIFIFPSDSFKYSPGVFIFTAARLIQLKLEFIRTIFQLN